MMEVGHRDGKATKSCYVSWAVVPSLPTRCVEASTRKEKGCGRSFVSPHGDRECTLIICSEQDSRAFLYVYEHATVPAVNVSKVPSHASGTGG